MRTVPRKFGGSYINYVGRYVIIVMIISGFFGPIDMFSVFLSLLFGDYFWWQRHDRYIERKK
jgi:hypothetical protein